MSKTSTGGSSLITILLVVFVVLKLTGNISWSWSWVLAPFWIPLLAIIITLLIYLMLLIKEG